MKPILQALVLAERIYEDKSGKKIIAGTFNRLHIGRVEMKAVTLPDGSQGRVLPGGTDMGCPSAYISLTDVHDGTDITLQFVNVSNSAVLFAIAFKINTQDRLATAEVIAPLPPITAFCNTAGTYSLDVMWKGEMLGSHRLIVTEDKSPQ